MLVRQSSRHSTGVLALIKHASGTNFNKTYVIKHLILSFLAAFAPATTDILPIANLLSRRCFWTAIMENGGNK